MFRRVQVNESVIITSNHVTTTVTLHVYIANHTSGMHRGVFHIDRWMTSKEETLLT